MKTKKFTAILIAVLALVAVAAAALHLSTRARVAQGALRVEYGGSVVELELGRLELSPVQGTVRNGKGEDVAVDGQGLPLSQVLERAGVGDYSAVTVTADDEYSAQLTAEEAARPDKAFLLLEEDGSLRLVVFGDENSKRRVSDVKLVSVS